MDYFCFAFLFSPLFGAVPPPPSPFLKGLPIKKKTNIFTFTYAIIWHFSKHKIIFFLKSFFLWRWDSHYTITHEAGPSYLEFTFKATVRGQWEGRRNKKKLYGVCFRQKTIIQRCLFFKFTLSSVFIY